MKHIQRRFLPGSEWLYIKLYGGEAGCDRVLAELILPFARYCKRKGWTTQWFFIRYADDGFHLRVRFNLSSSAFTGPLLEALNHRLKPWLASCILYRCCVDTYLREVERYGIEKMDVSESIFCIDSVCIAETVANLRNTSPENRALAAFILIDSFLESMGLDIYKKLEMSKMMDESYCREFGFNRHNMKQLNERYRQFRPKLAKALTDWENDAILARLKPILNRRDRSLKKLKIQNTANLNMTSILHMMMNRLFINKNRLSEMVIYNYLTRHYKSIIARSTNY